MLELLSSYFGYAFVLSVGIYFALSRYGEHHAKDAAKDTLALWLMGAHDDTWSAQFNQMFDSIFGKKHFCLKCLFRSAIASVFAVAILYILFGPVLGLLDTNIPGGASLWQVLLLGVAVNLVPDYISLWETRWILKRFQAVKSKALMGFILLVDLVVSASIIWVGITLWRIFTGQAPLGIGELLGAFSLYSIFFYSTFLTSVWAWLYCISSVVMRMFSGVLSKFLNVEKHPFRQLGLVGAVLLFTAMTGFKMIPEGRIHASICTLPGDRMPYHCIRTAPNAEIQLTYLDEKLGGIAFAEINQAFDRIFSDYGLNVMADIAIAQEQLCNSQPGYPKSCSYTGFFYHYGYGVDTDHPRAAALFDQACQGGYMAGCSSLGFMYNNGRGVDTDQPRAAALYDQACQGGLMRGCYNLGTIYDNGRGVDTDQPRAAKLFNQACQGGVMAGCSNLGVMYESGQGVATDHPRAAKLYDQACQGGEMAGCFNLGFMYERGRGVDTDQPRAAKLYDQACQGGDMAGCFNLGLMYAKGQGVDIDHPRAAKLYDQACQGGFMKGCSNLGFMYNNGRGVDTDQPRAAALYDQACQGGLMRGCSNLGFMYESGQGVDTDQPRSAKLFEKACLGGYKKACSY